MPFKHWHLLHITKMSKYTNNEDEELNPVDKESIFNKLIEEAAHKRYEGWADWRLDLLDSCSELADTPVLQHKLEKYLLSMLRLHRDVLYVTQLNNDR